MRIIIGHQPDGVYPAHCFHQPAHRVTTVMEARIVEEMWKYIGMILAYKPQAQCFLAMKERVRDQRNGHHFTVRKRRRWSSLAQGAMVRDQGGICVIH
jgi:hypothetical protein